MEKVFRWIDNISDYFTYEDLCELAGGLLYDEIGYMQKPPTDYKSQYYEMLCATESALLKSTPDIQKFIFRRLLRRCNVFFDYCIQKTNEWNNEQEKQISFIIPYNDVKQISATAVTIFSDMHHFYIGLALLCYECGYDISEFCEYQEIKHLRLRSQTLQNESLPTKYKTLHRSHRIAILKELLYRLGVSKNIDNTKIAGFVEAVTGGNIEAKPKDTLSYKNPTKDAIAVAENWLSSIGINSKTK